MPPSEIERRREAGRKIGRMQFSDDSRLAKSGEAVLRTICGKWPQEFIESSYNHLLYLLRLGSGFASSP